MSKELDNLSSVRGSQVERKLRRAWRKERRFYHLRGLCHVLVWLAVLILLDFAVDYLFRVPFWGRSILLAVNLAALGRVAYLHWWRRLVRYDPVRVALQVEDRHPELKSLLVSYIQIRQGDPLVAASPVLVGAMRRQTVDVTGPMDFREIISYANLKRMAALCLAVLVFFGAVSVNWSDLMGTLLMRLINPRTSMTYPTRTKIADITGDLACKQGQDVTVSARVEGVIPSRGTLLVRPAGGKWEKLALAFDGADRFSYYFPEVYQSFQYQVQAGDDESQTYQVLVLPPPRIVDIKVTVRNPDYTRLGTTTLETLNIEAPEGAEIEWALQLERPLARAELIRIPRPTASTTAAPPAPASRPLVKTALSGDGLTANFATPAGESFPYQFRWTDKAHGFEYLDEVRYHVQVLPDSAPEVDIIYPAGDDKATLKKTLSIEFQAKDDHAVDAAAIVYKVGEGPERYLPVNLEPAERIQKTVTWPLKESIPDLEEGLAVNYAVEVADNKFGGAAAQKRRSAWRQVQIVSEAEYLAYIWEKIAGLYEEVRSMHDQESQASREIDGMRSASQPATRPELSP